METARPASEGVYRDIRCTECYRLMGVASSDFDGAVGFRCRRCKVERTLPLGLTLSEPNRLSCPACGKAVGVGSIVAGRLEIICRDCKSLVKLTAEGATAEARPVHIEPRPRGVARRPIPLEPSPADRDGRLLALVEARWQAFRIEHARTRAQVAVGLRFAVFKRDGFRCRYCGRGVTEGAILEADHVTPRSRGGLDTMTNLVTACWDCNRGKSDTEVDTVAILAPQHKTPDQGSA